MERLYLIIFLVLIGAFMYWYRTKVWADMHHKKIVNKKHNNKTHKRTKSKSKSSRKKHRHPIKKHDTESQESDGSHESQESHDAVIKRKKQNYKKAYEEATQDSLSMDNATCDSMDSSVITLDTDTNNSSDFLSDRKKR